MKGWGWKWRRGPGRPPKPRFLSFRPREIVFIPHSSNGTPLPPKEPIILTPDEIEALRLVYIEELTQEEAAKRMGISRGTLWRTINSARKKIVLAVVEERPIIISSGT